MSRYCGETNPEPILRAVAHWKDVALVRRGSVFSEAKRLWTDDNLTELDRHFVQNPLLGEQGLHQKLERQLQPTSASAKQLAAEMFWLLYLCPSSLSVQHKRQTVVRIWTWSGEPLSPSISWLSSDVLAGIGSAGPGFNQNQWRELAFLIRVVRAFHALNVNTQTTYLADAWAFTDWLGKIEDAHARQFRHMLLFLLYPDEFERIFGQRDRRAIALAFSGRNSQFVNRLEPAELDRLLRETREALEKEYGSGQLDYYVSPLVERWSKSALAAAAVDIQRQHVHQALQTINDEGVPSDAASTGYDLIEAGKRYPPKYVLEVASGIATGERLDRRSFTGGEESAAFRILRELGFFIERKDFVPELLKKFFIQSGISDLSVRDYPSTYCGLQLKVSFGKGNVARIPWLAFVTIGQSVSEGIYPVLLFFREQRTMLLCYGVSETHAPDERWPNTENRQTVAQWFNEKLGRAPDRYGDSFVRASYRTDADIDLDDLNLQLDEMIAEYKTLMGEGAQGQHVGAATDLEEVIEIADVPNLDAAVKDFSTALIYANVSFGDNHDSLVRALLVSLATKPFVILTGLSGSGKTQIAVRLGEWFGPGRLFIAAVRPDWTGSEAVFGYEDALRPVQDGRAAWAVPGVLEFILKAARNPDHPYLLVLDEMNLAHVERYLADVLSGMESRQHCLPNLTKESDGCWRIPAGQDARVPFPRNLWVVGTVNVDETTYMFSPKVLDRANVFEFRVTSDELRADAIKPVRCSPGDPALVRGLHTIASDDGYHLRAQEGVAQLTDRLRYLHRVLSRYGMEFGHRTFYESLRFAGLMQLAGADSIDHVLDRILIQKILPRLHGARKRLEAPLLALAHFARDLPTVVPADDKLIEMKPDSLQDDVPARLPISHDKVSRMLRSLRANQFASFTE